MSNNDSSLDTKPTIKTKHKAPSLWRVIFHNDDFTPMDFVVHILQGVFNKNTHEAIELTMTVHQRGKAQVALYSREIALQKVSDAMILAEKAGHPLLVTTEEA